MKTLKGKVVQNSAQILVIVGALNWGLDVVGYNIVEMIPVPVVQTTIYSLVGISGLIKIMEIPKLAQKLM